MIKSVPGPGFTNMGQILSHNPHIKKKQTKSLSVSGAQLCGYLHSSKHTEAILNVLSGSKNVS